MTKVLLAALLAVGAFEAQAAIINCNMNYYAWCCAPGEIETNVAATDRALGDIAARPDFERALKFQATLEQIASLPTEQKAAAYLALANVRSTKEVVEFVSARQVKEASVKAVSQNLQLNAQQTQIVVAGLRAALNPQR